MVHFSLFHKQILYKNVEKYAIQYRINYPDNPSKKNLIIHIQIVTEKRESIFYPLGT